jgi:CxxC-x17-CxxC domain-containing protein
MLHYTFMGDYNRDNRDSRNSRFDRGNSFKRGGFNDRGSSRGSDRAEMYPATCDKCGKSCEVPFKPTMGKPVFCRDCFVRPEGNNDRSGGGERNFNRPRFEERNERPSIAPANFQNNQLEIINNKLDKILQMLTPIKSESTFVAQDDIQVVDSVADMPAQEKTAPQKKTRAPKKKPSA